MDDFDKKLRQALSDEEHFDSLKSDALRKEVVKVFDKKLKKVRCLMFVWLAVYGGVAIFALWQFLQIPSTSTDGTVLVKRMLLNIFVALIAIEGTVLIKLWCLVVSAKIGILKELKQLQLQIADLTSKKSPS